MLGDDRFAAEVRVDIRVRIEVLEDSLELLELRHAVIAQAFFALFLVALTGFVEGYFGAVWFCGHGLKDDPN